MLRIRNKAIKAAFNLAPSHRKLLQRSASHRHRDGRFNRPPAVGPSARSRACGRFASGGAVARGENQSPEPTGRSLSVGNSAEYNRSRGILLASVDRHLSRLLLRRRMRSRRDALHLHGRLPGRGQGFSPPPTARTPRPRPRKTHPLILTHNASGATPMRSR